jgi:hypothetical protein
VNQSTHYGIPVVVADADSDDADAVAVDIAAAINGAQDWIRANYGDTSFVSGMPTAADGTAIVTMATFVNEVNDVNAAWTWVEAIADSTFVAVQGSSVDVFIGEVSVTNGPVQYTTDDPGTVAVLIVAANANAINHSVFAAQGTNSSHIRLTQRWSGALGVLSAVVTRTAAIEGGSGPSDFSGDTDTFTAMVSGGAANLPTSGGPFELFFRPTLVDWDAVEAGAGVAGLAGQAYDFGIWTDVAISWRMGGQGATVLNINDSAVDPLALPAQGRSLGIFSVAGDAAVGYVFGVS